MIPKKIHYCWFGRKPLPDFAKRCIASWRKYLPDYEIIEWNEANFDVHSIPYTSQAYDAGKYAFVSDYARFKILYDYGGIYFDTDVEVIKTMDDIIDRGPFMGFEIDTNGVDYIGDVAPGLGLAILPGDIIYADIIDYYKGLSFYRPDGSLNTTTVVAYTTKILKAHGLKSCIGIQNVAGINIYPSEYFNPLNDATGRLRITQNTRTIHWFSKTWMNVSPMRIKLSRLLHRIFGVEFFSIIRKLIQR